MVPGERTGLFCDINGLASSTPSRPVPRPTPRAVDNRATRQWFSFYGAPGLARDAGSKFKGKKKSLRVTFGACEFTNATALEQAPSGDGGAPEVPPLPLGGSESVSSRRPDSARAVDVALESTAPAKVRARNASNSRWASHLSLPDCRIADTGCGYDLMSKRWVDELDHRRLTQIRNPPTFAGVGGSVAAKMKP